ncbi:hypothetical protein ACQZ6V_15515 [Agrobacterium sp. 22-3674b3]
MQIVFVYLLVNSLLIGTVATAILGVNDFFEALRIFSDGRFWSRTDGGGVEVARLVLAKRAAARWYISADLISAWASATQRPPGAVGDGFGGKE